MEYLTGFFVFAGIGALLAAARYLAFALVGHSSKKRFLVKAFPSRHLAPKTSQKRQIIRELKASFRTACIFGVTFAILRTFQELGFSQVYSDISQMGMGYFLFTIPLIIILHDTYFYWAHRAMHHPKIYKQFHSLHHRSHNPTPFTSWSFDSKEAIVHSLFVVAFAALIPVHIGVVFIFTIWSMAFNVIGHIGHEVFPKGWSKTNISNTVTHHHTHHQTFKYNYGLYFPWWDKIMGTEHPHYHQIFAEVVSSERGPITNIATMARHLEKSSPAPQPQQKAAGIQTQSRASV